MTNVKPFYFGLSFGVNSSCMPESYAGAFECTTRREMVSAVRDTLQMYELPANLLRQVKWKHLFQIAKRSGTSSQHFSLDHRTGCLNFHGMTKDEYDAWNSADN